MIYHIYHRTSNGGIVMVIYRIRTIISMQYLLLSFRTVDNYRSTSDQICYLHALVWGIIDITNHQYYSSSRLDRPSISRLINGNELSQEFDKHFYLAYQEVLSKNTIPLPDRLFSKDCQVDSNKLYLNYGDNIFSKDDHGNYHLSCVDTDQNLSFELKMEPLKSVCRQAHHGIVNHLSKQESMFYYFIPRLKCHGKLNIQNQSVDVQGQSWYDHEFGGSIKYSTNLNTSLDEPRDKAWYWFSIQLDNQYDITIFLSIRFSYTGTYR